MPNKKDRNSPKWTNVKKNPKHWYRTEGALLLVNACVRRVCLAQWRAFPLSVWDSVALVTWRRPNSSFQVRPPSSSKWRRDLTRITANELHTSLLESPANAKSCFWWNVANVALTSPCVCSLRDVPARLLGLSCHHAQHRRGGRHDGGRGDARRPLQWGATALNSTAVIFSTLPSGIDGFYVG